MKAGPEPEPEPEPARESEPEQAPQAEPEMEQAEPEPQAFAVAGRPLNDPGHWDTMISYTQRNPVSEALGAEGFGSSLG